MSADINLASFGKKVFKDSLQDGITEILTSILFVFFAITYGKDIFIISAILGIFVLAPGIKVLKKRFTYPRTGYVELDEDKPKIHFKQMAIFILIVAGLAAISFILLGSNQDDLTLRQWSPAIAGVICSAGFFYLAHKSGLVRLYIFVAISVISGIILSALKFEGDYTYTGMALFCFVIAIMSFVSGIIIFIRFLQKNPPMIEEMTNEEE
ncbi:MAG: hypothetical protein JSV17_00230 [Candidatus Aminicenantes bacterium]|nr:MAG: hypothetical protein JSV17_00230 [Candidatus Aminicenantes bacterium]